MAVTLDIDGSVEKINAKLNDVTTGLENVADAYDEVGEASKKAVGGSTADQDRAAAAAKKNTDALEKHIKTVNDLESYLKRLEVGQKKVNDPKLIKAYNSEIVKTKAAIQSLNGAAASSFGVVNRLVTGSQAVFTSLKATIATTFAPLAIAGAAVAGITSIVAKVTEFEQVGEDLSAITGAQGDTLEFLKQSAVETALETTAGAAQTLEAYKLIASAKPELLKNAEALASITREAVTLSEAMGGELPTVAQDLTDIMNKFQAPASEAARFVNALAAGSKEGSAEVGQLAQTFLTAGTELRASNVVFEESVGLAEALAEQGLKGAEAGTALRNVASKLSASELLPKEAIDRLKAAGVDMSVLSDKSLTFTDRLRALAPVQNDANALTAVFGLENKSAAKILIDSVDRVDELTTAVTGTNVANEQAATRTATARGEFERLKNTLNALVQSNGDGLGGLLALILSFVRNGLLFFKDVLDDLRPSMGDLVASVGSVFTAISNLLPAQDAAGEGFSLWDLTVKAVTGSTKLAASILTFFVSVVASVIDWVGRAAKASPTLGGAFDIVRKSVLGVVMILGDLPAIFEGSLASVLTFASETAKAIGTLGRNIGNVLSEAFNIPKLLSEGTGGLSDAVSTLLVNPFKGVGSKAGDAFSAAFNAAKARGIKTTVTPASPGADVVPGGTAPIDLSTPAAFVDPDEAKKAAEKATREAEKAAKDAAQRQQEINRATIDAMKDGRDKQLAQEELRFKDLKAKLIEYGLATEEATYQHELNKFEIKQKFLSDAADLEGISGEERINFLFNQTKAEIDAIEAALKAANGGTLLESQVAQINLLRKQASDSYLKQLTEFQTAEQQQAQEHEIALLELKAGDFKTALEFEEFKEKEILNIRLKYAEAQLALIEKTKGAESDAALALKGTINGIKADIEGLAKSPTAKGFSLYNLIGLDPNNPKDQKVVEGIELAASKAVELIQQVNASKIKAADEAIAASDKEIADIDNKIAAKEAEIEAEIDLGLQGFANKENQKRAELELLKQEQEQEKAIREKALNDKKKAQKAQLLLDTATQGSSLITASAQIFQSVASIPFAGVPIAIGLIATMIAAFAAAKVKAFQNINRQARRGLTGVATGRRHEAGGEYFGEGIEFEQGERYGILSREATAAYGSDYAALTNAANSNDRVAFANIAAKLAGERAPLDLKLPHRTAKKVNTLEAAKSTEGIKANNEKLKENIEALNKNNELLQALVNDKKKKKKKYLLDKVIITTGNHTRILKTKS